MPLARPVLTYLAERGVRTGESPRFEAARDEASVRRRFFVKFAERHSAVKYFLGYSKIAYDDAVPPNPTRLERLTPMTDPATGWYAERISVLSNHKFTGKTTGLGDGATGSAFLRSEIEVTYTPRRYRIADDASTAADQEYTRYVEVLEPRMTPDVLNPPVGTLRYAKNGGGGPTDNIVPFNVPVVQPTFELTVRWIDISQDLWDIQAPAGNPKPWWRRIKGDDAAGYRSYVGTLNKEPIFSADAGQLLFVDWRMVPKAAYVDDPAWSVGTRWDVEFVFQLRTSPGGHNAIYFFDTSGANQSGYYFVTKSNPAAYQAPGAVADDTSLFSERPFSRLFRVQADPP